MVRINDPNDGYDPDDNSEERMRRLRAKDKIVDNFAAHRRKYHPNIHRPIIVTASGYCGACRKNLRDVEAEEIEKFK